VELLAVLLPLVDLVLLVGVVTVLMRGTVAYARWPLRLLLVASCLLVLSSAVQAHDLLNATAIGEGQVLPAILALVAVALYACAAIEQLCTPYVADAADAADAALRSAAPGRTHNHGLPYLALVVGYGLLMATAVSSGIYPWIGLIAGAIVMTGSVAARQLLALRENSALVVTDSLTGLANRRPVDAAIVRALDRSARSGTPMAVLLLDLNGFKQVNDQFGHDAGDRMLVAFAQALLDVVRPVDLVARLGGDEFAIVLDDVTLSHAETLADRILAAAAATEVPGLAGVPIRCSIGIAVGDPLDPEHCETPDQLLQLADRAMYHAKRTEHHGWRVALRHGTAASPSSDGSHDSQPQDHQPHDAQPHDSQPHDSQPHDWVGGQRRE
jgi:diguanylate cyclase (GGDEF)-like protein